MNDNTFQEKGLPHELLVRCADTLTYVTAPAGMPLPFGSVVASIDPAGSVTVLDPAAYIPPHVLDSAATAVRSRGTYLARLLDALAKLSQPNVEDAVALGDVVSDALVEVSDAELCKLRDEAVAGRAVPGLQFVVDWLAPTTPADRMAKWHQMPVHARLVLISLKTVSFELLFAAGPCRGNQIAP